MISIDIAKIFSVSAWQCKNHLQHFNYLTKFFVKSDFVQSFFLPIYFYLLSTPTLQNIICINQNPLTLWWEAVDVYVIIVCTVVWSPGTVPALFNSFLGSNTVNTIQPYTTLSLSVYSTTVGFWCIPE